MFRKEEIFIMPKKKMVFSLVVCIFLSLFFANGVYAKKFLTLPFEGDFALKCGFGGNDYCPTYTTHTGSDYPMGNGTPIVAAADGLATAFPDPNKAPSYGNRVYVDHGDGWFTRYAHLSSFATGIVAGAEAVKVYRGQVIGYSGTSGGPWLQVDGKYKNAYHLHFEVRHNDVAVDPYDKDNWLWTTDPPSHAPNQPTPQNSTFIKFSGNPAVYYVFKDQLWPLRNETTFKNMGNSDFSKVVEYPASQYEQIVAKFPVKRIIVNEHLIAKLDCNPKVYRFSDGKWHCFSDWDVFTSWGYSDKDIVEIPQAVFNMYPEGTKLAAKAYDYTVPLAKEWNYSLGHAFADSISGNSDCVRIEYQGKKVSLAQAIANGWIYKKAYGYDDEQGFFEFTIKDGEFKSGTRYFIYSSVVGAKLHMYGILDSAQTQSVNDMDKVAGNNSKLSFKELYSLRIVPDWSPSWNLRVMSYKLSSSQTSHTWFNHATYKSDSSVRYIAYKNPDTGSWTSWQRVY